MDVELEDMGRKTELSLTIISVKWFIDLFLGDDYISNRCCKVNIKNSTMFLRIAPNSASMFVNVFLWIVKGEMNRVAPAL